MDEKNGEEKVWINKGTYGRRKMTIKWKGSKGIKLKGVESG